MNQLTTFTKQFLHWHNDLEWLTNHCSSKLTMTTSSISICSSLKTIISLPCSTNVVYTILIHACVSFWGLKTPFTVITKSNHDIIQTPFVLHYSNSIMTKFIFRWTITLSINKNVPMYIFVTPDHKTCLKSLEYICSNSQKYIVWVKMIHFSFMPKIIRILSKDLVPWRYFVHFLP